jgi:hypothetical protein
MYNINLSTAYFGLDSRVCERLEYLFIYLSKPARKNIVPHFCKLLKKGLISNTVNFNEA